MFCISCGRATPDGASFCPGCGKQFQRERPLTRTCTSCRTSNPDDALFCWNCGRQLLREENRADFILPIPNPALPGGVQPPVENVPMVQATPQTSGVPTVEGTPSPSMGRIGSQRATSSSAQAGAQEAALAPGQAGAEGVALSMGQAASSLSLSSAPSASSSAPNVSPSSVEQQTNPTQSPPQPSPQHPAGPPPTSHPTGSPMLGQHVVGGGIKVAGHLSRRAVLSLLAGGAVVVVAGTGAIVYLTHSPLGGSTPEQTTKTLIDALMRQDYPTAYDQLSTRLKGSGEQQFASFFTSLGKPEVDSYTLSLAEENGSTATVAFTGTSGQCAGGGQEYYHLVKENGVWKVDALPDMTVVCWIKVTPQS